MMNKDELVSEISSVIIKAVNLHHIDRANLNADTALAQDGLGLDSIDILEAIIAVEQHFGVKVADAELGKKYFSTLGTIAEFIQLSSTSAEFCQKAK